MPAFRYNGRTARGEAVNGALESDSAEALATHLFARGITPIEIKPVAPTHDVLADLWERLGGGRPTLTDLILFSRQMYAITKAGVPLHELPLQDMQAVEPRITKEALGVLSVEASVKSRVSYGGTAPKNVLAQAKAWLKRLEKERKLG